MSEAIFNKYMTINNEFYKLYRAKYNQKLNYNVLAYAVFEVSAIKGVYPDEKLFDDIKSVELFDESDPIFSSLASSLVTKTNVDDIRIELRDITKDIVNIFYNACRAKIRRIDYKYNIDREGNIELVFGFSKFNVSKRIVSKLRKLYNGKNFSKDLKDLILRYAPLIQGSAVNCQAAFVDLFSANKITFELFASPFNVDIKHNYFALYREDELFGSLGNFFASQIKLDENEIYQCNPVFSDKLLYLTAKRIMEIEDNKYKILIVMPDWLDSYGIELLMNKYPSMRVENDYCSYIPGDDFKYEEQTSINIGSATRLFAINM